MHWRSANVITGTSQPRLTLTQRGYANTQTHILEEGNTTHTHSVDCFRRGREGGSGGSLSDFLSASFAHLSVRGARGTSFVFIERRERKWWWFSSQCYITSFSPCNFVEPRSLDIRMSERHASKGAYSSNSKVIIGKVGVPSNGALEHSLCMRHE